MSTSALVFMLVVQISVTLTAFYFLRRIVFTKTKQESFSKEDEND